MVVLCCLAGSNPEPPPALANPAQKPEPVNLEAQTTQVSKVDNSQKLSEHANSLLIPGSSTQPLSKHAAPIARRRDSSKHAVICNEFDLSTSSLSKGTVFSDMHPSHTQKHRKNTDFAIHNPKNRINRAVTLFCKCPWDSDSMFCKFQLLSPRAATSGKMLSVLQTAEKITLSHHGFQTVLNLALKIQKRLSKNQCHSVSFWPWWEMQAF